MASQWAPTFLALAIVLVFALSVEGALVVERGKVECSKLEKERCAYAVSYSGKRCVLEKQVRRGGMDEYRCGTSEIDAADELKNWMESDECIKACGLNRNVLGISSDSLLDSPFAAQLCSNHCYAHCPNIVDLYFNLAAAEGVYLPKFCEANGRREMREIKSSGFVAESPQYPTAVHFLNAPSFAPF